MRTDLVELVPEPDGLGNRQLQTHTGLDKLKCRHAQINLFVRVCLGVVWQRRLEQRIDQCALADARFT